jgi:hypothetical protein
MEHISIEEFEEWKKNLHRGRQEKHREEEKGRERNRKK